MPPKPNHRRPALGGALRPTKEDAQTSQEVVFEYSQQLNQKVVALESENLELRDTKGTLETRTRDLAERVGLLEKENNELRDAGFATFQERNVTVHHAQDVLRAKQGEVMLLRHTADQHQQREQALATNNARLSGIAERLQGERSQLQRQVLALEATQSAMQAEIAQQANSEAHAAMVHRDLDRQVNSLTVQKMRHDEELGSWHIESAHHRHTVEEFRAERQFTMQLREELNEAAGNQGRLREEATKLGQTVSALHVEVAHMQQAKEVVDAEVPRLHDAVSREGALATSLRGRIAELEDLVGELRRGNMALEGENGGLRSALTRARAEVDTCLKASNKLVQEKGGVEQLADAQSTRRIELERQLSTTGSDCNRFRKHNEQLQADNQDLQARSDRLEAENVVLRGQLKGQEVILRGLQGERMDLNMRKQYAFAKDMENSYGAELKAAPERYPSPPRSISPQPIAPTASHTSVPGQPQSLVAPSISANPALAMGTASAQLVAPGFMARPAPALAVGLGGGPCAPTSLGGPVPAMQGVASWPRPAALPW